MDSAPRPLLEGLSPGQRQLVVAWWAGLGEEARGEVADLWDARRDSCSWATESDDRGRLRFHALPVRLTATPAHRAEQPDDEEWQADFAEYLLGRPEVYLREPPPLPTFSMRGEVAA